MHLGFERIAAFLDLQVDGERDVVARLIPAGTEQHQVANDRGRRVAVRVCENDTARVGVDADGRVVIVQRHAVGRVSAACAGTGERRADGSVEVVDAAAMILRRQARDRQAEQHHDEPGRPRIAPRRYHDRRSDPKGRGLAARALRTSESLHGEGAPLATRP